MNNRRRFMVIGASTVASATCLFGRMPSAYAQQQDALGVQNLPTDQVHDFVRNAHTNLKKTKELLAKQPRLIRATYEWAPGDFESAIGAAAHSGATEIVKYLLSQGASYSIFAAAVLGHIDTITATIKQNPGLINCRGPHGIPLLAHALAGGKQATKVVEFLTEQGAEAEEKWADLAFDETLATFVAGRYQMTRGDRAMNFTIEKEQEKLFIIVEGRPQKRLLYQGQARFNIEGTPAELNFERVGNDEKKCQRVLLQEGFPVGFGIRRPDK